MNQQRIVTAAAALVAAGGIAFGGAALAQAGPSAAGGTLAATPSATGDSSAPGSAADGRGRGPHGMPPGQADKITERVLEHGLAGETAVKVTQAATAKEPTAYLLRVWKHDDGGYRAHMMRPDGSRIILTIDGSFSVTKVEDAPRPGKAKDGKPGKAATTPATPSPTGGK